MPIGKIPLRPGKPIPLPPETGPKPAKPIRPPKLPYPIIPRTKFVNLTSCSWVAGETQKPQGNRLRWSIKRGFLQTYGLPDEVIIERAPLSSTLTWDKVEKLGNKKLSIHIPNEWWKTHEPSKIVRKGNLPVKLDFRKPVQGVSFTFKGPDKVRMKAYHRKAKKLVVDWIIADGQNVLIEAPFIDSIVFLTYKVKLENIRTLNLYEGFNIPEADFVQIAKINPKYPLTTASVDLERVLKRCDVSEILGDLFEEYSRPEGPFWKDLQGIVKAALEVVPIEDPAEFPHWQKFEIFLKIKWALSVICGFGFADGPDTEDNEFDKIETNLLLRALPQKAHAYRVRCRFKRPNGNWVVIPSNITVCRGAAIPLLPPILRKMQDPQVQYGTIGTTPNLEGKETYNAKFPIMWEQQAIRATGIDLKLNIGRSEIRNTDPKLKEFDFRSARPETNPTSGVWDLNFEVPCHDVLVSLEAKAIDGWDRISAVHTEEELKNIPLKLIHHPIPPRIVGTGAEAASSVRKPPILRGNQIILPISDYYVPTEPSEEPEKIPFPDPVVLETPGSKVIAFRRIKDPETERVKVSNPVMDPEFKTLYSTRITEVSNLTKYRGGFLIIGRRKYSITKVTLTKCFFKTEPDIKGQIKLFRNGKAKLQQSPTHPDLWERVASFSLDEVKSILSGDDSFLAFNDSTLPEVTKTHIVDHYALCVAYYLDGREFRGPFSNIASILRELPSPPSIGEVPSGPAFIARAKGIDFYDRTLVRIQLNFQGNTTANVRYVVCWAPETVPDAEFPKRAKAGVFGSQKLRRKKFLYEVLSIPIPETPANTRIKLGIQATDVFGTTSPFLIETIQWSDLIKKPTPSPPPESPPERPPGETPGSPPERPPWRPP